jgi:hypothetical protein
MGRCRSSAARPRRGRGCGVRERWEGLTTERLVTMSTGDSDGDCGEGGASVMERGWGAI